MFLILWRSGIKPAGHSLDNTEIKEFMCFPIRQGLIGVVFMSEVWSAKF